MSEDKRLTIQRERLMWLGVIILSLTIISLWGYALFVLATHTDLRRTQEGKIIENTKKNWDTIFVETKTEEKKKQSAEQIKQIISQLMTAPTTTTNITTTSTATTTKL